MNGILDLPNLPFWSAAVRRRIHNDSIVMIAAADLTLYEFYAIIHDPADRRVLKAAGLRVLLCPGDHALGGVNRGHGSSGFRSCQCCSSGVGEEV